MDNQQVEILFDFKGVEKLPIRISLNDNQPFDVNEVSAAAKESNTCYEYSGRHDHGDLPVLKSRGPLAVLINSIDKAKAECDAYLTECINIEYGYDNNQEGVDNNNNKAEKKNKKIKLDKDIILVDEMEIDDDIS